MIPILNKQPSSMLFEPMINEGISQLTTLMQKGTLLNLDTWLPSQLSTGSLKGKRIRDDLVLTGVKEVEKSTIAVLKNLDVMEIT